GVDTPDGVIVASDGSLLAETHNLLSGPDGGRAYYASGDDLAGHGVDAAADQIVDLACAALTDATDMSVAHTSASTVTHGAARRTPRDTWALDRIQAAAQERDAATAALAEAETTWRASILAALAEGATQTAVATSAGVSRGRIGQIEKEATKCAPG